MCNERERERDRVESTITKSYLINYAITKVHNHRLLTLSNLSADPTTDYINNYDHQFRPLFPYQTLRLYFLNIEMGNLFSSRIVDKNWRASSDVEKQIVDLLRTKNTFVCIEDFKVLTRILENGGYIIPPYIYSDQALSFRSGRIDELSVQSRGNSRDIELSGEIGKLDALQRLTLLYFRSLPSDWSNMKNLKQLRLDYLYVNVIDLAVFSTVVSLEYFRMYQRYGQTVEIKNLKVLSKIKNLTTVKLYNCKFKVEAFADFSSLKHLELDCCESIDSIYNLPSLQSLLISSCHSIKSITNLPSLQRLQIIYCDSNKRIDNLPSLQELELYGNWEVIDCDISSCSQTLKSIKVDEHEVQLTSIICPNVTHFEVSGRERSEEESSALQNIKWATTYLPSLESFYLNNDYYELKNSNGLVKALCSSRFDKLRHLDIGNYVTFSKGDFASFFFSCLKRFPCLEYYSSDRFSRDSMDEIVNSLRNNEEYARLAWNSKIRSFLLYDEFFYYSYDNDDYDDDHPYDFQYIFRAFPSLQSLSDGDDWRLSDQCHNNLCLNQAGRAFVEGRKGVAPRTLSKAMWPALLAKAGRRTYSCTNKLKQATDDEKKKHQKTLQCSGVYYLLRNGPVLLKHIQERNSDVLLKRKSTSTVESPSSKRPKLSAT